MISRTPRRAEDQNFQQQHQRKFGNIVNRMQKSMQIASHKFQPMDKYQDTQNVRPHLTLYHREEKSQYIETDRTNNYNLQQNSQRISPKAQKQMPKKQSINRNRQFDAKVDNINKMHDQISSMLKYVKSGQSKSLMKPKQPQHDQSIRTEDNIQRIIKQRMRDQQKDKGFSQKSPVNRSKFEFQNQITPITQEEAYYRISINGDRERQQPKKLEIQQHHRQRAKINYNQNNKKPINNYLEPKTIERLTHELSGQLKQTSKLKYNYEDLQKQKKQRLYDYKNLSHLSPKKTNQKSFTPKKNPVDVTPKKQVYNYDFNSREEPEQRIGITRAPVHFQANKEQKNNFDYDYEISKVKERIQSSEQMTKKMEQKYLGSHKKSTNNYLGTQTTAKFEISQSIVTRTFQNLNHTKQRTYNDIIPRQTFEQKTEKSKDFQLKVYPCNSPIHNERLKKDEACKVVAQRLSDQIKLDQRLRDARQSFNQCQTADKWKQLQQKLNKLGFTFTQQELENQLAISSSQTNPFNNDSAGSNNSINELAQTFAKSQQFWQKKLRKFISKSSLEKSGFSAKQMDLDQRGYLSVEDLVCFINLHSSNFFRNRDIICLFRRMVALGKNRNGIEYETFVNIISQ